MADYNAIVVGAGCAGSVCAYRLGKAGMSVLLVDRGDTPGTKNMTGGRLYGHSLEQIMPGFAEVAPVERAVVRETVSMMTAESVCSMDFHSSLLQSDPKTTSYTVLRARFDAWLAEQAEQAGCDLVCPTRVDSVRQVDDGEVCITAGQDEITANVVVLADGVNSLLAQQAGLKPQLTPHTVAVGVKEIIQLSPEVIEARFGLESGQGAARLFAGMPSQGLPGGGFIYTNRDSLSIGIVVSVAELKQAPMPLSDMLERFKHHPAVRPLLAEGRTAEYAAHLIPEAGLDMLPQLTANNMLVAGDAAGLCLNLGYTVRGMDFAIASGGMAAEAVIEAKEKNDFSKAGLQSYETRLNNSFVLRDLHTHRGAPQFMAQCRRMFNEYPELAEQLCMALFRVQGNSSRLVPRLLPLLRAAGPLALLKDLWSGARAL